jgi:hypothetical protein
MGGGPVAGWVILHLTVGLPRDVHRFVPVFFVR